MSARKRPCELGFFRKCDAREGETCLHCLSKIIKRLEKVTFEEREKELGREKTFREKLKLFESQLRNERNNLNRERERRESMETVFAKKITSERKKLAEEKRKRIQLNKQFSELKQNLEPERLDKLEEILKGTAKYCECGCGELIRTYSHGDYRRFKNGHGHRGKNHWNYGGTISKEQVAAMKEGHRKAKEKRDAGKIQDIL